MPAIANISIFKADGTTNVIWTGLTGAAGDKTPAVWRSNTVGASVAQRPQLNYWAYNTPSGSHRVQRVTTTFPVLQTDGTVVSVLGYSSFSGEFKTFLQAPDADVNEFAFQTCNIMGANGLRAMLAGGFPPS